MVETGNRDVRNGGNDDNEIEAGDGAPSLVALEDRRREIQARLRVVTHALRDAGAVTDGFDAAFFLEPPPPDVAPDCIHERFFRRRVVPIGDALWKKLSEQRFTFDPPDRFRVEWQVNALGIEKCRLLWDKFDHDGDDAWSFADFYEYVEALEERMGARPQMRALCANEEVWRMFTSDALATDADHRLTFEGFLRYRETLEDTYALQYELPLMGISLEWGAVETMRRVVQLVDQYVDADGLLPLRLLQFLAAECGTVATYRELRVVVQRMRLFHRCHRFVLAQKRALRLFGYKQKSTLELTDPALETDSRVCRVGLLALLLSAWTPAKRTRWRAFFLEARLVGFALLRKLKRRVATVFDWTRRVALTGLLSATCLQSTPERELGDYVLKVDVGPTFSAHSTISMTYYSDADSAATLHELKYLERGAECFVYIDLMCRNGTREVDAQALCQRLTWFVELFLKDHLQLLPFFFKWFVTIPSKMQLRASGGGTGGGGMSSAAGAAPVVRFVILFTGEMDLYAVMQSLKLPSSMQFDHLLQRLSMRWMFSHSIEEVVTNKRFVAGSQWSCRGQLDARFNRQAWGQILRQCATRREDEVAMEREERAYVASQQQRRQQDEQQTGKHTTAGVNAWRAEAPGTAVDGEGSHEGSEWIEWLHRVAHVVGSSRELSLSWAFPDLLSVLEGNAWVKTVLPAETFQWLHHLLSSAGAFASEWKGLGDSFRAEFARSRYVEKTLAASAAAFSAVLAATASRSGVSRVSSRSTLGSAEEWLGIGGAEAPIGQSIAASFPFASPLSVPAHPGMNTVRSGLPPSAPVPEGNDSPGKQCDDDTNEDPLEPDLLELYEACVKTLQSVHALRAEAGTSGLAVAFEGWSIFSILPRVVPVSVARKASLVRTKSSVSNASTGGSVSAVSGVSATSGSGGATVTSTAGGGGGRRRPSVVNL